MFCPQCGHQQLSNETRYCSRCGLTLGLVTDLIGNDENQLQREKRELWGIQLMLAAVLILTNLLIVFGAVALPHFANPILLWLWVGGMTGSLLISGIGITQLIRSGFFKRLTEREARLRLMKSDKEHEQLNSEKEHAKVTTVRSLAPDSVTETTTRELEISHKSLRKN